MEPFGPKPIGLLCFHESLHFVEFIYPILASTDDEDVYND